MDNNLRPCPDCGCKEGDTHEPYCDIEQCAECGRQRLSCSCRTKKRIPWASDRGDIKDAIRLGWYAKLERSQGWVPCDKDDPEGCPDLNRLLSTCTWNKRKWRWEPKD